MFPAHFDNLKTKKIKKLNKKSFVSNKKHLFYFLINYLIFISSHNRNSFLALTLINNSIKYLLISPELHKSLIINFSISSYIRLF